MARAGLILFAVVFAGCGGSTAGSQGPSAAPASASSTPAPIATQPSTTPPTPTATIAPTPIPTPTAIPASILLLTAIAGDISPSSLTAARNAAKAAFDAHPDLGATTVPGTVGSWRSSTLVEAEFCEKWGTVDDQDLYETVCRGYFESLGCMLVTTGDAAFVTAATRMLGYMKAEYSNAVYSSWLTSLTERLTFPTIWWVASDCATRH